MERKSDQRRFEIARAAIRLFVERGYDNVTAEQIAAEVGIGTRTFFRYFATKEDAAFPDHEGRVARYVEALRRQRGDGDPVGAVARSSAGSIREFFDNPDLYRARYRLVRSEPALRAHERVANGAYEAAIVDFLTTELGASLEFRLYSRAVGAAVVAAVDAILDEWAEDELMDVDARIENLNEVIGRLGSAMPGSSYPSDPLVIVLADDPHLRRELTRIIVGYRRARSSMGGGLEGQAG